MTRIKTKYLGELRTEATHIQSGTTLITDAPIDNHGKGEYFSPTDLVATALGSCMVTIMGIAAKAHHFSIDGTTWEITKVMSADTPRRIAEIKIELKLPHVSYTDQQRKIIDHCIKNCPVALSLHPEVKQTVSVIY
jgi:uncharacterized OsmC-like protein